MINRTILTLLISCLLGSAANYAGAQAPPVPCKVKFGGHAIDNPNAPQDGKLHCLCEVGYVSRDQKPCVADSAEAFCRAKAKIIADQRALRSLNFNARVEQFEMYAETSSEQRGKMQDLALDQTLEAVGLSAKNLKSLNPWNIGQATRSVQARGARSVGRLLSEGEINRAVDTLALKGLQKPIVGAMRIVAKQSGKPEMAESYEAVKNAVMAYKEGHDTGMEMRKDPEHRTALLALGALKVAQQNPYLGVWVSTAEGAEALSFYLYLNPSIDSLDALTEDELRRATQLSIRLNKADMPRFLSEKKNWQRTHGGKGEPVCPNLQ